MLIKTSGRHRSRSAFAPEPTASHVEGTDRRTFLKRSGVAAGSLAVLGNLPLGAIRKADAGPPPPVGAEGDH